MTDNDDFKKVLIKQFTAFLNDLDNKDRMGLSFKMLPGAFFIIETLSVVENDAELTYSGVHPQEFPSQ